MPDTHVPVRWEPGRAAYAVQGLTLPPLLTAMGRGLLNRCPSCGKEHVFAGYLRVVDACSNCGAPLGQARADDAPPYFTILIVGHIVVPLMFLLETARTPPLWVHAVIFLPLTVVLCLGLLRPIKGATVGLMLKNGLLKTQDG